MREGTLSNAVGAFFGTLGQLQDRKDAKEDREGERRWKAFYMEHLQGQEARAQESHEQDMAKWEVEKEGMLREAEAREEFFAKYDVTPESWAMMAPMEQFAMAKENFAMAKELHTLDLESRRFDLGLKQRMAPLQEARARYLASGAGRGGGSGKAADPLKDLQGKYLMMEARRKSIQSQIESHAVKDALGNPDYSSVPPALLDARDTLDMQMTELNMGMAAAEQELLGLTGMPAGATGGEAEVADPMASALGKYAGPTREAQVAEQKARDLERARAQDLGQRAAIFTNPLDGTLVATDDPVAIERAAEAAKAKGVAFKAYRQGEVPAWAVGLTEEEWRRKAAEKDRMASGFALGPGGAGFMR